MTGGDQFMVHRFLRGPEVTREALLAALDEVARVIHPEFKRLVIIPITRGMGTEPGGGWPVAILATDAVGEIECAGALVHGSIQRMASQTACLSVGLRQSHDIGHPHPHRIR
jgi:hypothetical protein